MLTFASDAESAVCDEVVDVDIEQFEPIEPVGVGIVIVVAGLLNAPGPFDGDVVDIGDELVEFVSWSSVSSSNAALAFFGYKFILMSAFCKRLFGPSVMKPPLFDADVGGC